MHGTYDFLLFAAPILGPWLLGGLAPLLIGAFFLLRARIRTALDEDLRRGQYGQIA